MRKRKKEILVSRIKSKGAATDLKLIYTISIQTILHPYSLKLKIKN